MKALVLAGGSGSRLRPITHTSAKQLLPVANKPVLFYGLEAIRDASITDVGIVVGDTEPAIRAAVGDGSGFDLSVTYIRQDAPRGLAHAVLIAREFLGDDPFVMYLGDNFIVGGIAALVAEFTSARPDAQIMLTRESDPRQFGVAELGASGEVIGLEEKPEQPKSDLALVGVYIFTAAVHEAVRRLKPSWRGELEITEAIQWLLDHGRKVRSTIITAGTRIDNSYVGPFTSVAPGCVISGSEIEYSIVMRGASIQGVRRIEASLIGHDVEVTPSDKVPRAHRLVLGDHSKVQISS